jgi:hypothetical protein
MPAERIRRAYFDAGWTAAGRVKRGALYAGDYFKPLSRFVK